MRQWMKRYQKALVSGAVCLVLALALALGGWAVLRTPRQTPQAPEQTDYPGLNIEPIGLRYDRLSQTQDSAAGGEGDGSGQSPQPEDTQQPETPPQEEPLQPETPPQEETKPEDKTPEEQPDPSDQEDQQPEEGDDQDKEDEEGPVDGEDQIELPQGPQIATDLKSCTVSQEELSGDLFSFTALILNGDEDTYLQASITNSKVNNRRLTASDGDYATKLVWGRNEITLTLKKGSETIREVTYVIDYRPDANSGETENTDGLTIRTNLSSDTVKLSNRNLTFTVWAMDKDGKPVYQDNIRVELDGKEVRYSSGSGAAGLEYNLRLSGSGRHTVTIWAWDDKNNISQKTYIIDYEAHEQGEKIGTATVRLDLSVLGLPVVDVPVTCDIFQDQPASYVIKAALESLGYQISYTGTLDSGFYLSRISRSMTFGAAQIPAELQQFLEKDGLSISQPGNYQNSLGEFDYTQGSGWMYAVNGVYPGRGFSEYFLSDGDVLTLRFTLAKGKDIGGGNAGGGKGGYCGTWIDGVYTSHHKYQNGICTVCGMVDPNSHTHHETETITKPATCTETGEKTVTCADCGQTHTEVIPATGHQYHTECRRSGSSFVLSATCTDCNDNYTETIPEDEVWEISRTEATCSAAGSVTYRVYVVVDGHTLVADVTETLPQREHSYENGVCSGCGQRDPNAPDPDPDPDPENPDPDTPDPDPASGGEENLNEEETA